MNCQKEEKFLNEEIKLSPQKKIYIECFYDTFSLKHISESNIQEYIKDIKENGKIIGRKFLRSNKEVGYVELFLNSDKQLITNLTENITFLYPPNGRLEENIIGIRYYKENSKRSKDGYFTLVKKDRNSYEILEKIKDGLFFEEKVDCLEIIKYIIFNKINNNLDYISGLSFIELLGFFYCAKELLKDNCIMINPYSPNPLETQSIKESFDEKKINTLYIEPIFYCNHVSILLFTFTENKERNNILLDISHFHSDYFKKDNFLFPKEMKKNLKILPRIPIQLGETCGLWFIGQLLYIITQGINILKIINDDSNNYIIQIINYITDLLKITKFINNDKITLSDYKTKRFAISKAIAYNQFLNVGKFFELNKLTYINYKDIVVKYGEQFSAVREMIIKLEMNFNHYKNQIDNDPPIREEDLSELKDTFIEAKNIFNEFFDIGYNYFYKENFNVDSRLLLQRLEKDLDSKFDFIKEIYNLISDECYVYSNEEFKEFYFNKFNCEFKNYFDKFFN